MCYFARVFPKLCLLALVAALLACSGSEPRPNVLLLVVDTLRAEHVGCYGAERPTSPHIDRLAAGGVRFERAYATSPWTKPSVASILTGLHPSTHGVMTGLQQVSSELRTLPEILSENGYATFGLVSNFLLRAKEGFGQGFERYDASEIGGHSYVSTPGLTEKALVALEDLAAGERPFFLFVHYFDPHYNYRDHAEVGFAPSRAGRLDGSESIHELRRMLEDLEEDEIELLRALYDEEVRFTDAGIGSLLEKLERLGLGERTVVVLTADHGEEFLERGWLGHTRTLYEELVWVPLVVRAPGLEPGSFTSPVSLVSVESTVLDLVGIEDPGADLQGLSLLPLLRGQTAGNVPVFAEVDFSPTFEARNLAHKKAVIGGRYKLIRDDWTGDVELYDLLGDPGERVDLAASRTDVRDELLTALDAHLDAARQVAVEAPSRQIDQELIDELIALGYAEEP